MQDEITEMKRKLKIMNHQIDQLKEEISTKESALVKEHLEHQRVEKDKVGPAALGYKLQWVVINGSAYQQLANGWLGSRVVSVLDSGAEGPGFKSQSRRCRVTVLGKLSTPIVPLFTKQQNW